jgi:hypothetical protein
VEALSVSGKLSTARRRLLVVAFVLQANEEPRGPAALPDDLADARRRLKGGAEIGAGMAGEMLAGNAAGVVGMKIEIHGHAMARGQFQAETSRRLRVGGCRATFEWGQTKD